MEQEGVTLVDEQLSHWLSIVDELGRRRPRIEARSRRIWFPRPLCRKCYEGFLRAAGRCCDCRAGRRRAWRMAEGAARVEAAERRKRELAAAAMEGPDYSRLFGKVPAVKNYGFKWG